MRSDSGSTDGRLVAGGVTLAILIVAAFIAALIVSGVIAGNGSGGGISISGDSQTLGPDPDGDNADDDAVTQSENTEPSSTQTSNSSATLALGDTGDDVRELQARLRQIQWYQADVTGEFDEITVDAVRGFQAKRDLEVTGEVDDQTWNVLVGMTETPTEDEMYNRFEAGTPILSEGDEGEQVRELQARLKQIGWFDYEVTGTYGPITTAAVEGFQTKRGIASTGEVDQNTWDILVEMTRDPTSAEIGASPPEPPATTPGLPEECVAGRVLCIDRKEQSLRWVVDGETRMTLDVRFGTELNPVREGEFTVDEKRERPRWFGGFEYMLYFDHGQAVHYSEDFDDNGSSGSVKVADKDAMKQLFEQVKRRDGVFVYRS